MGLSKMTESSKGISVVVCCHNSAAKLPNTLFSLAHQDIHGIEWEIILVNNASTDDTQRVALESWSTVNLRVPLKIVDEPRIGLSFAKERGIKESSYDYIIFCDDDNWLGESYVRSAFHIMENHPEVAIAGGWCTGVYDIPTPSWIELFLPMLSIYRIPASTGNVKRAVLGAGMILRKLDYHSLLGMGFKSELSGRKGSQLASGEDTELCQAMMLIGRSIYFSEDLYFKHYMPSGRLTKRYILKLLLFNVSHNNILAIYDHINKNNLVSFNRIYYNVLWSNIKRMAFFCARFLIKSNRFYSGVMVLHHIKTVVMLGIERNGLKQVYHQIKKLLL